MQNAALTAIFLLAIGLNASPVHAASKWRAAAVIPGYEFSGCYTEATAQRALTGSALFDDQLMIKKCAAACEGFEYFGFEYGRECYCGNVINAGRVKTAAADCNFHCPGNPAQGCGAGNRLNLYRRTSDPTPSLVPTTHFFRGCYAEPTSGRALTGKLERSDGMDVEMCAGFCSEARYSLFGLEYYTEVGTPEAPSRISLTRESPECLCGNALMPGVSMAPCSDCSCPCVAPAGYTSEGCYTEASNGRVLSDASIFGDDMTVGKCAAACDQYTWFGVEYEREAPLSRRYLADLRSRQSPEHVPEDGLESATSSNSTAPESTTSVVSSTISSTTSDASTALEITTSSSTPSSISEPSSSVTSTTYIDAGTNEPCQKPWSPDQAHAGLYSGAITYNPRATAAQTWFNQVITLAPNTRYDLSASVRPKQANPGCAVRVYIGTSDGDSVLKIMSITVSNALSRGSWTRATGFFDSGTNGDVTFNVRLTCTWSIISNSRTFYIDDILFTPQQ
ncbi:putative fungistatic metabolite [Madurella mycetomatis]|uniref:Fungistatic metabolite n=1 Tax=Madurella mycetomatis TaxID=100816 RepID=A0A175WF79_9PEZI|nr:putative fungistatic metabolite [Madurella mycetomatis]